MQQWKPIVILLVQLLKRKTIFVIAIEMSINLLMSMKLMLFIGKTIVWMLFFLARASAHHVSTCFTHLYQK